MTWLKLDDRFAMNPKIIKAGPAATYLHLWGLCYSAQHLTDGLVPREVVEMVPGIKTHLTLAGRLVELGLWEVAGDDFTIHDYLDHNPSRTQVEAERAGSAERMRKSRSRRYADVAPQQERNTPATGYAPVAPPHPIPSLSNSHPPHQQTAEDARANTTRSDDEEEAPPAAEAATAPEAKLGVDIDAAAARVGTRDHQRRLSAPGAAPVFDPAAHLRSCIERRRSDPTLIGLIADLPTASLDEIVEIYDEIQVLDGTIGTATFREPRSMGDVVYGRRPSDEPSRNGASPARVPTDFERGTTHAMDTRPPGSSYSHPAVKVRTDCPRCEGRGVRPVDENESIYVDCECKEAARR
jgi:hypothetical protein